MKSNLQSLDSVVAILHFSPCLLPQDLYPLRLSLPPPIHRTTIGRGAPPPPYQIPFSPISGCRPTLPQHPAGLAPPRAAPTYFPACPSLRHGLLYHAFTASPPLASPTRLVEAARCPPPLWAAASAACPHAGPPRPFLPSVSAREGPAPSKHVRLAAPVYW
jgi:hypothetical protein